MDDSALYAMDPEPDTYRVGLLPATELLLLQLDAARGDVDARCVVTAAIALIQEVATAPHDQPARCACCPQPIRRGDRYLIGVVLPAVGDPTIELGFLVCDECGFTAPGLDAAVAQMVRRHRPDDGAMRVLGASVPPDRTSRGGGWGGS